MELLGAAFAVYMVMRAVQRLVPRQIADIWLVLISLVLGQLAAITLGMETWPLYGLAATGVAASWHTLMRLVYLAGDAAKASVFRTSKR